MNFETFLASKNNRILEAVGEFNQVFYKKAVCRNQWLWMNNLYFLLNAQINPSNQIPFDKDLANWLLLALKSAEKYEDSFYLHAPFLVEEYKEYSKKVSVISCKGNDKFSAIIPYIRPGYYNYYNGKIIFYCDADQTVSWKAQEEKVEQLHSFFDITLDIDYSAISKLRNTGSPVYLRLNGNTLSNKQIYGQFLPVYVYDYRRIQRALHVQSLGYKAFFEFSSHGCLRMNYNRGVVYLAQYTV